MGVRRKTLEDGARSVVAEARTEDSKALCRLS